MSIEVRVGPGIEHPSVGGRSSTHRVRIRDGSEERRTTIHVARWPLATMRIRLVVLEPSRTVEAWCREAGVAEAINGGFFTKPVAKPLGFVACDGTTAEHEPFGAPWDERRGALWLAPDGRSVEFAPRAELEERLARAGGSLLQSSPLLVRDGTALVTGDDDDPEGLSSTCEEFDSDITEDPLPRMALGIAAGELLGVAVDGRTEEDDGLLLHELASLLVELGADAALNLDGGSSASLVTGGARRNHPRDEVDHELLDGYPTSTLLAIEPAEAASVVADR